MITRPSDRDCWNCIRAGVVFKSMRALDTWDLNWGRGADTGPTRNLSARSWRAPSGGGAAGGGLFLTSVAYSVYIVSVISFLAQLDALPEQRWRSVEAEAINHLVPGASQWGMPSDFHRLRQLGFPKDFVDMQVRQLAIRLRVSFMEAASTGGL